MAIEMIEEFDQGTMIKVIGVGGGGGNAVEHMIRQGVTGVQFVCANTDAQALNRSDAGHLLQLGKSGLGAGSKPEVGRAAAEEAVDSIREAIDGAHMLFITAGMGGGTGTGAAPVIARVAKEMGILTVGVVTKPFEFEGKRRGSQADSGVVELEANVDSLIVVLNEKLLEVMGDDVTQEDAFAHANDVLKNAVGGISDIIHVPGLVNVDFEDVKTVMSEPGKAMMGTAQAGGPDRATKAADLAVACPLLEGIDLSGARVLAFRQQGHLQAGGKQERDEHHPPLRRRRRARHLRHRLRRRAGRPAARDRDRHRVVVGSAARAIAAAGGQAHRAGDRARAAYRHRQPAGAEPAGADPRRADAAAGLQQPEYAERLAHCAFAKRRGQGRSAVQQRHGRDRDPGVPAQAGRLKDLRRTVLAHGPSRYDLARAVAVRVAMAAQ